MSTQPDISVIIVSYNVWPYLQQCTRSVVMQQGVVCEIIVVDNNSSDNSPEQIRKVFTSVHVIANRENKGFSGANNQGIAVASGKYILLLNPDTEMRQSDVLVKMKQFLENRGNAIIAPCLLNADGTFQKSFWLSSTLRQLFLEVFYLHRLSPHIKPTHVIPVKAASGAALFLEKELFTKIGLLDENMFWMEDIDLCYRARQAKAKVLYYPDVEVIHYGGKSSDNYSVVMPNQIMSKIKFYKKNSTKLHYLCANMLSLVFIITRLCVFTIIALSGSSILIKKRKAYAQAMVAYFRYNFSGNEAIVNIKK